jgi:hypothetical protein
MPKSSLSSATADRTKEPSDSVLEAPISLTPEELETVAGGTGREGGGGTTTGYNPGNRASIAS